MCLLSPSVHGLGELLSVTERFAAANEITSKSVCLYFKPKSGRINPNALFFLNNKCIKKERSCKYLGHIISDNEDIRRQIRSLYARSNMLIRTFCRCSRNVKRQLIMTYFGNMYTAQLWGRYTKMQMQKLRVAYNNAFRRLHHYDMFCSASEMFVSNRINTLDVCLRRVVHSFAQIIYNSHNTLIKHIVKVECPTV